MNEYYVDEVLTEENSEVVFDDFASLPADEYSSADDYGISPYSVDTPVYGSLNSTFLEYFDRIADGLPNDYVYVAFRDSNVDNYSGVMVYGRNYTFDGSTIVFGEDTTIVTADRVAVAQTGYNQYTYAYSLTETSTNSQSVPVSVNGTTLYYTNADVGYMTLGSGNNLNLNYSPFICIGLISAAFTAVLTRLLSRR